MAFFILGTALPTATRHFKDTKSLIEQEFKARESIIKMVERNIGSNPGIALCLTEKFLGTIKFPEGKTL